MRSLIELEANLNNHVHLKYPDGWISLTRAWGTGRLVNINCWPTVENPDYKCSHIAPKLKRAYYNRVFPLSKAMASRSNIFTLYLSVIYLCIFLEWWSVADIYTSFSCPHRSNNNQKSDLCIYLRLVYGWALAGPRNVSQLLQTIVVVYIIYTRRTSNALQSTLQPPWYMLGPGLDCPPMQSITQHYEIHITSSCQHVSRSVCHVAIEVKVAQVKRWWDLDINELFEERVNLLFVHLCYDVSSNLHGWSKHSILNVHKHITT